MTSREFYNAIISNETNTEEVRNHAMEEIEKMNKRNAARSSKPNKKQKENEPIIEAIINYLTESGGALSTEIATTVGVSTSKVCGLCGVMVKDGVLNVEDRKVPKKGTQKFYTVATA